MLVFALAVALLAVAMFIGMTLRLRVFTLIPLTFCFMVAAATIGLAYHLTFGYFIVIVLATMAALQVGYIARNVIYKREVESHRSVDAV